MKNVSVLIAFLMILSSATAYAQSNWDLNLRIGDGLKRNMGVAPLIVNRNDPTSTFLFKGNTAEYSPTIGLAVRRNTTRFFFEGEALYYSIRKSYEMQYIDEIVENKGGHVMKESCKSIEVPLSAGVKLGYVEIRSGFSMRYEFGQSSSLSDMPHYQRKMDSTVFGWHSGIGVNLGRISAEVRYQQDFANYGQGIFVNDQELLLKNSPTQLRFMIGVRLF